MEKLSSQQKKEFDQLIRDFRNGKLYTNAGVKVTTKREAEKIAYKSLGLSREKNNRRDGMSNENVYSGGVDRFFPSRKDSSRVWVKDIRAKGGGYWRSLKKSSKAKTSAGAASVVIAGAGLAALNNRRVRNSSSKQAKEPPMPSTPREKAPPVDYKKYEQFFRGKPSQQESETEKYMNNLLKRNEGIENIAKRRKDSSVSTIERIIDRMKDLRFRL